jgi:hypothetical protein
MVMTPAPEFFSDTLKASPAVAAAGRASVQVPLVASISLPLSVVATV